LAAAGNDVVAAVVASRITEDSVMMASLNTSLTDSDVVSARSISHDSIARRSSDLSIK